MKLDRTIDEFAKGTIDRDEFIIKVNILLDEEKLNLVGDIMKEGASRYVLIRHRNDLMRKTMNIN